MKNNENNHKSMMDTKMLHQTIEKLIVSSSKKSHAILILLIEDFTKLNLDYGNKVSSVFINELTQRIKTFVKEKDYFGQTYLNEYCIIIPNILNQGQLILACNKLLELLSNPYSYNNRRVRINIKIGVNIIKKKADNKFSADSYIRETEIAANIASKKNKPYMFYDKSIRAEWHKKIEMEKQLQDDVENNKLALFFQPIIDIKTNKIVKTECLLRWKYNDEFIPPNVFIPIATRNIELITKITSFVINSAIRLSKKLLDHDIHIITSINISAMSLADVDFIDFILKALDLWGLRSDKLIIEITESELFSNFDIELQRIKSLYDKGIKISIDDFGTGHSSLARLKFIPFSELKIDRSFIMNICSNNIDSKIVMSIITLAHAFGANVIAEGVEDEASFNKCKELGCDYIQGFYFSKPLSFENFVEFYNNNRDKISHDKK